MPKARTSSGESNSRDARRLSTSKSWSISNFTTHTSTKAKLMRRATVTQGEDLDALVLKKQLAKSNRRASMTQNLLDGSLDAFISQSAEEHRDDDDSSEPENFADEGAIQKQDAPEGKQVSTTSKQSYGPMALVLAVVICGCACQAPFETLNKYDRGCGDLISFAQFTYGVVASAPEAIQGISVGGLKVPVRMHIALASANLGYFVLLNQALATSLPLPVLVTLKNGNLASNLIVGLTVMRRTYNWQQVGAVLVVTGGLVLTALTGTHQHAGSGQGDSNTEAFVGVAFLVGALMMRALNGAFTEMVGNEAPVSELLFVGSALGLPYFALKGALISSHVSVWNTPDLSGMLWPAMWILLLGNLVFDYLTKVAMTTLIGETSALTATMVLTVQRFIAFVISALIINPTPGGTSATLWIGSGSVLLGTFAYSTAGMNKPQVQDKKKEASEKTNK